MDTAKVKKNEGKGLWDHQKMFLALTLVVMIIIIMTVKNLTVALVIVGLIANFFIISSQMTMLSEKHMNSLTRDENESVIVNPDPGVFSQMADTFRADAPRSRAKEGFTTATTAPPGAGPPSFPVIPETNEENLDNYPGAIDFGETDEGDEAMALGHVDWNKAEVDNVPEGNPFSINRVSSPQAAGPCVDDDAIAIYDGDELNTYQVRSRNQPERVWAGIYRRKALMDRYVQEELDERENSQWWGAHEV